MSVAGVPHPLPAELLNLLSEGLTLIGDATRIRILDELREGQRNVQSIADALTTTQQNVCGHLRRLRAAGVVARRAVGREVFYMVADETVFHVWACLVAGLQGAAAMTSRLSPPPAGVGRPDAPSGGVAASRSAPAQPIERWAATRLRPAPPGAGRRYADRRLRGSERRGGVGDALRFGSSLHIPGGPCVRG